jgi:hypothetical protein
MTTETKTADIQTNHVERSTLRSPYVLVPVILCLPIVALWGFSDDEPPQSSMNAQSMQSASVASNETPAGQPVQTSDETYRKLIVGNWETDRDGRRFLKVFEDGTAVMDVEIPGNWSLLFGKKMKFNIVWSIEDGVLTFETTGGEPKGKVDLITSMYGEKRVQKIERLDETTMRLPDDEPDGEDHVWTRVGPVDSQRL